jgi:hypothetical protein
MTFLEQFSKKFTQINKDNLDLLETLYTTDIEFIDPLHRVNGLDALTRYFEQVYENVATITFVMHSHDEVRAGEGYMLWRMRFSHPRLKNGDAIEVEGCSHIRWTDDKVYYHRDYFDAGAMLYEHLPVMGRVIAWLKRRLA